MSHDDVCPAQVTDLYELTMLQGYLETGMHADAVFSLFVRRLPPERNFLLACGLDEVLGYLETLRFDRPALDYLATLGQFSERFLRWLEALRFRGSVRAMPEGTPFFADEPVLEIRAPLPEAQLVETLVMNQIHLQTLLASKAARVVHAARGRPIVDFGLRRIHGIDAGLKSARAFHVAGVHATSNVAAGQRWGVPVAGTMAHSWVQAHDDEYEAFRRFAAVFPETVLLVDTYDTLDGVRKVVALARALGDAFRVRGVRLDSGDLAELARGARALLDEAGLQQVEIFASGSLDEAAVAALVDAGAPIDAFGVGTKMGVSADAPSLDMAYKLVEYAGRGRMKLSSGKSVLPGPKQVFRREAGGRASGDVIAAHDERLPGRPLLEVVMSDGERTGAGRVGLDAARERARRELALLPEHVRELAPAEPAYPVEVSAALREATAETRARVAQGASRPGSR